MQPQQQKRAKDLTGEIEALRDEIRLKIHLAEMDAKSEWNELEPRVRSLEEELIARGEQLSSSTRERARELRQSMKSFLQRHFGQKTN